MIWLTPTSLVFYSTLGTCLYTAGGDTDPAQSAPVSWASIMNCGCLYYVFLAVAEKA